MHKNCAKDVSSKLAASALISLAFTVIDLSGYKAQLGGKMDYVDESDPFFWKTFCENWRIDNLLVQQYATVMTCLFLDMSLQLCEISFSRRMKCKEPRPSWPSVFSMDWFHASWELSQPWWSSSCALICPTNHGCESYWSGSWSVLKIYIRQATIDLHQAGNYW